MTVLQLILMASHLLIGIIFYTYGKAQGKIDGRIEEFQRVNG